jgi:hypothetical protein
LVLNTVAKKNIIRIQAALGDRHEGVGLFQPRKDSTSGIYVDGTGCIPVFKVDDLALMHCDFLVLDIEGKEMAALQGAKETIIRCRPVLMFEDKGYSERYGVEPGAVESWLSEEYGYRTLTKIHRDTIMLHTLEVQLTAAHACTSRALTELATANIGRRAVPHRWVGRELQRGRAVIAELRLSTAPCTS